MCDICVTIDGSLSNSGWCARDGVVTAISVLTCQVVDTIYLSSSCKLCTLTEEKRKKEEILRMEYMKWFIDHNENCYFNHNGSASVSLRL